MCVKLGQLNVVLLKSNGPTNVLPGLAHCVFGLVLFMVFNATFNNISLISLRSVLLVEETGVPGENHCAFGDSLNL
jgi:hypothetical protein